MRAISLFSGAGGMDVGATKAGFDVVLANDIDRDACASFRLNHSAEIFEGSISELLPELSDFSPVDVIFGGPPCQGFSVAGKMDPGDPRSGFIRSFFEAIEIVRPLAFVCENVKALAVLGKWEALRAELMARGNRYYEVQMHVLRASDYGVPQNRDRMFIVGVRRDVASGLDVADIFAKALSKHRRASKTVGEVIRELGPAGAQGNSRVCNARITYAKAPILRSSAYAGMLFNGAGRPLQEDGVSATLPASMGGNRTPIVDERAIFSGQRSYVEQYHSSLIKGVKPKSGDAPDHLRRLTVDECLAFQTFPSGYKLAGSRSAMYKQIGNAVPCQLAYAVMQSVAVVLKRVNMISAVKAVA
jgi:DNA (cytosine-5)-methyltransferase 1